MLDKTSYHNSYLPYIKTWGKRTSWLAIVISFGPAIVLALGFGLMPPINAIITAFISIVSAVGVLWVVEPVSYFPIIGMPGTYMAFVSGNISNLRVPCAAIAQDVAGVKPGSEEGIVVSTLGMGVSVLVNIALLTIGVVAGSAILEKLPASVIEAFNYLLPALFGAIFVQFALKQLKIAPVAIVLGLGLTLGVNAGIFNFLPGVPTYVVTLGSVFGTILVGRLMYKKGIVK